MIETIGNAVLWDIEQCCFLHTGTQRFMSSHVVCTALTQLLQLVLSCNRWIWGLQGKSFAWGCPSTKWHSLEFDPLVDLSLKTVIGISEGCVLLCCACMHVCFRGAGELLFTCLGPFSILLHLALCPGWLTCEGCYISGRPCPLAPRQVLPWEGLRRSEGR